MIEWAPVLVRAPVPSARKSLDDWRSGARAEPEKQRFCIKFGQFVNFISSAGAGAAKRSMPNGQCELGVTFQPADG